MFTNDQDENTYSEGCSYKTEYVCVKSEYISDEESTTQGSGLYKNVKLNRNIEILTILYLCS